MKKVISIFIIVQMLFAGIVFAADNSSIENTKYEKPAKLLSVLGIMDNTNLYGQITRGEFAEAIAKTFGYNPEILSSGKKIFSDVDPETDTGKSIDVLYYKGFISANDTFNPDNVITGNEAVKIISVAMGADMFANENGGYPQGYLKYASDIGILKNVSLSEGMVKGEAAVMLYNALRTYVYENEALLFAGESQNSKTLMYKVFKLVEGKGRITGTDKTRLYSSDGVNKGLIEIDNKEYFLDDESMNAYLGYNVDFYYVKENSEDKIILCIPTASNNVTVINSENIIDADNFTIRYYNHYLKETSIKFGADADYILNGKCAQLNLHSDLEIPNGQLILLDNDNDGKIDVIFAQKYINYVVSAYSDGKIYSKFNKNVIDLDMLIEDKDIEIDNIEELKAVTKWSIVSVYCDAFKTVDNDVQCDFDNAKNVRFDISKKSISGMLNSKSSDEAVIDGITYLCDSEVYERIKNETTLNGIFYLDASNKLAAVDFSNENTWLIGILGKGFLEDSGDGVKVKLFTEEGKWETVDFADKVTIDGVRNNALKAWDTWQAASGGSVEAQLIRYKQNSSKKIVDIDTVKGNEEDGLSMDFQDTSRKFRTGSSTFEGKGSVSAETKMFIVPGDISNFTIDTTKEKKFVYYENAKNYLANNTKYDFQLYNVDDAHCSKYIVLYKDSAAAQTVSSSAAIGIFNQYSTVINDDNEVTHKISYYTISGGVLTNKETTVDVNLYKTVSDSTEAVNWSDLKKGDLLRINSTSELVDAIEYVTSLNTDTPTYSTLVEEGSQSGYIRQYRVTRGRVYSKNGTLYSIYYGSDIEGLDSLDNTTKFDSLEAQSIPGTVYIFDKENESFEQGNTNDVTDYMSTGNPDECIVVYQSYGNPVSIIVVR